MGLTEFRSRYFDVREDDDICVVVFTLTHINDEENIEELGHELFAMVEQFGARKVVLNMSSVEYVTSSVIGKIITLHRKLHRSDGMLCLSDLTRTVADVLATSRLLNYFAHAESERAAIERIRSTSRSDSTVAG